MKGNITMSRKESNQIPVFVKLTEKSITQYQAGQMLHLTIRQIRNKLRRYEKYGNEGLLHRTRGKPSKRKWDEEERMKALKILESDDFKGFGPTFASEKLSLYYDIKVSIETLRKSMIQWGIWHPHKRKVRFRHRRPRKPSFGQFVQIDGSVHDWFEGRGPKCTLLVFIDDATSKLLHLEFAQSESTQSVMKAMKTYIQNYGRPLSIYVDYGSVFSVNTNNPDREKLSQFERSLKEIDVKVLHATSPQAKGRVERAHGTLQDRLIKEMRLAQISSIEQANEFIKNHFLSKHNEKYARVPLLGNDMHRSIHGYDLDDVFCIKHERSLQKDFVLSYKKRLFQLTKDQKTTLVPRESITIKELLDGSIKLFVRKTELFFKEIFSRSLRQPCAPLTPKISRCFKPTADHPWKKYPACSRQQAYNNERF